MVCKLFRFWSLKYVVWERVKKTSILKVLHGNTKSPTGCMYSWRYNILLEAKEGIWSSFKIKKMFLSLYALLLRTLVIDLHAKNRHNICKSIEKSLENSSIVKFTKCKTRNFAKIKEVQQNSNLIPKSWWLTYMPKISSTSARFRKKVRKTVWSLKLTKSKARNFAKKRQNVTKLKLDL